MARLAKRAYFRAVDRVRDARSRTLRAATLWPAPAARLAERTLTRSDVAVADGLAGGLRFPTRAVGVTRAHSRLLLTGLLEVPVQEALRRSIAPGDTVWDVGAHIGFFTLLAARLTGESGSVVAFEPVAENAATIRAAAALNGLHVEVNENAVGGRSGREELLVIGEAGWSHLAARGNVAGVSDRRTVEVLALDDVPGPAPAVIKLDVEGSEADVLRGAARLLRDARPVLIIETHDTTAEVVALLRGAGYDAVPLDGPTLDKSKYLLAKVK